MGRSGGKRAVQWYGCRSETHSVRLGEKESSMYASCQWRKKVVKYGVSDVFDAICEVCTVSTWVAGELSIEIGGQCEGDVELEEEEENRCTNMLSAIERNGET